MTYSDYTVFLSFILALNPSIGKNDSNSHFGKHWVLTTLGLTLTVQAQTGVQSETKCSFVATKFRYATLWTPF